MSSKSDRAYVVATRRPWNIQAYQKLAGSLPGRWSLMTSKDELTVETVEKLAPRYIFFPHWSHIVPSEILAKAECVCFHETAVPFGRGGSPIQNLIARGYRETVISALRMTDELDAGPVYLTKPLSLEGLGEEIFLRAADTVWDMIRAIVEKEPVPVPQEGDTTTFKRRTPDQSEVPAELSSLEELFDHVRMLDADEYPRAFVIQGGFKYELSRPALRTGAIEADVRITRVEQGEP